ncbi:MAG: squalene--hopene cyclase [Chloroflexota bacterium]|nr:squalene--hopene cyclase [Chloroflexota bacterium]
MAIAREEDKGERGEAHPERAELPPDLREQAEEALRQGVDALLRSQSREGWWCGELEANVTIQAEYILLMQFLGLRDDARRAEVARYIDLRQQDDGGWPIYFRGPSDLSTTIEAYIALKLAGRDPEDERMRRARQLILAHGSLPKARVFTKLWLALFGEYPWDGLPVMPPELMFFPSWLPLNIYDFSSWARGTIVPLLMVMTLKPSRPFPENARVPELRAGLAAGDFTLPRPRSLLGWRGAFYLADQALRRVRFPAGPRARALAAAERWVLDHQERDGSWGGIQPPWVYSIIALSARGYGNDHPVIAKSLAGMEDFGVRDAEGWRVQPCVSPVWDAALALLALADAGLPGDHPALHQAIDWLLEQQLSAPGDWQVRAAKGTPPGGWAFEFSNVGYPDTDDTAIVALALHHAAKERPDVRQAIARAVRWLAGMRSRNGAWGSFDVDNCRTLVTKIPFADFGETIDPPTEDVTAHVLECLSAVGYGPEHPLVRDAVAYLLEQQEGDGSWWGRWGVNYLYGVGAVLPALRAAGIAGHHPAIRRAVAWLRQHQLPDGGWGEGCESYDAPAPRGEGPSTPSQTAWALLGLIAAGEQHEAYTASGIRFLVDRQREDGTWDEPEFTGTGFPRAFMINYHLYRQYFPVMALGRWLRGGPAAGGQGPEFQRGTGAR